ncbi:hypothetical protein E3P84_02970 [Wallemia ichthyophaga]|nr:hypothetical protein E3P84_02970 [Wallemia ichthyophaga]TIB40460.1 hypothetical protein E3P83_02913 [Wallemia ichthyophaga]
MSDNQDPGGAAEVEYNVEKLLEAEVSYDAIDNKKTYFYYVKWEDYSSDENSWEPESCISTDECIKDFWNAVGINKPPLSSCALKTHWVPYKKPAKKEKRSSITQKNKSAKKRKSSPSPVRETPPRKRKSAENAKPGESNKRIKKAVPHVSDGSSIESNGHGNGSDSDSDTDVEVSTGKSPPKKSPMIASPVKATSNSNKAKKPQKRVSFSNQEAEYLNSISDDLIPSPPESNDEQVSDEEDLQNRTRQEALRMMSNKAKNRPFRPRKSDTVKETAKERRERVKDEADQRQAEEAKRREDERRKQLLEREKEKDRQEEVKRKAVESQKKADEAIRKAEQEEKRRENELAIKNGSKVPTIRKRDPPKVQSVEALWNTIDGHQNAARLSVYEKTTGNKLPKVGGHKDSCVGNGAGSAETTAHTPAPSSSFNGIRPRSSYSGKADNADNPRIDQPQMSPPLQQQNLQNLPLQLPSPPQPAQQQQPQQQSRVQANRKGQQPSSQFKPPARQAQQPMDNIYPARQTQEPQEIIHPARQQNNFDSPSNGVFTREKNMLEDNEEDFEKYDTSKSAKKLQKQSERTASNTLPLGSKRSWGGGQQSGAPVSTSTSTSTSTSASASAPAPAQALAPRRSTEEPLQARNQPNKDPRKLRQQQQQAAKAEKEAQAAHATKSKQEAQAAQTAQTAQTEEAVKAQGEHELKAPHAQAQAQLQLQQQPRQPPQPPSLAESVPEALFRDDDKEKANTRKDSKEGVVLPNNLRRESTPPQPSHDLPVMYSKNLPTDALWKGVMFAHQKRLGNVGFVDVTIASEEENVAPPMSMKDSLQSLKELKLVCFLDAQSFKKHVNQVNQVVEVMSPDFSMRRFLKELVGFDKVGIFQVDGGDNSAESDEIRFIAFAPAKIPDLRVYFNLPKENQIFALLVTMPRNVKLQFEKIDKWDRENANNEDEDEDDKIRVQREIAETKRCEEANRESLTEATATDQRVTANGHSTSMDVSINEGIGVTQPAIVVDGETGSAELTDNDATNVNNATSVNNASLGSQAAPPTASQPVLVSTPAPAPQSAQPTSQPVSQSTSASADPRLSRHQADNNIGKTPTPEPSGLPQELVEKEKAKRNLIETNKREQVEKKQREETTAAGKGVVSNGHSFATMHTSTSKESQHSNATSSDDAASNRNANTNAAATTTPQSALTDPRVSRRQTENKGASAPSSSTSAGTSRDPRLARNQQIKTAKEEMIKKEAGGAPPLSMSKTLEEIAKYKKELNFSSSKMRSLGIDGKLYRISAPPFVSEQSNQLRLILTHHKCKEATGNFEEASRAATLRFIHLQQIDYVASMPGITDARCNKSVRFFLFGKNEKIPKELWKVNEIYRCGGLITFTSRVLSQETEKVIELLELFAAVRNQNTYWQAFVLDDVYKKAIYTLREEIAVRSENQPEEYRLELLRSLFKPTGKLMSFGQLPANNPNPVTPAEKQYMLSRISRRKGQFNGDTIMGTAISRLPEGQTDADAWLLEEMKRIQYHVDIRVIHRRYVVIDVNGADFGSENNSIEKHSCDSFIDEIKGGTLIT